MKKSLSLLLLCTALSSSKIYASNFTVLVNSYSIERPISLEVFKERVISMEERIDYTNKWLDELSNTCKESFSDHYECLFNKYAIKNLQDNNFSSKQFKYRKLKEKAIEYKDFTYVEPSLMYETFITAKNAKQLLINTVGNKDFAFFPYLLMQIWSGLNITGSDDGNNSEEPGSPEMALDKETVLQFLYQRTKSGELESLSLCFTEPKYSLILGRAIGKFGKSATIDELWDFINPTNLLRASVEYAKNNSI